MKKIFNLEDIIDQSIQHKGLHNYGVNYYNVRVLGEEDIYGIRYKDKDVDIPDEAVGENRHEFRKKYKEEQRALAEKNNQEYIEDIAQAEQDLIEQEKAKKIEMKIKKYEEAVTQVGTVPEWAILKGSSQDEEQEEEQGEEQVTLEEILNSDDEGEDEEYYEEEHSPTEDEEEHYEEEHSPTEDDDENDEEYDEDEYYSDDDYLLYEDDDDEMYDEKNDEEDTTIESIVDNNIELLEELLLEDMEKGENLVEEETTETVKEINELQEGEIEEKIVNKNYDMDYVINQLIKVNLLAERMIVVHALEDTKEFFNSIYSPKLESTISDVPEVYNILLTTKRYIEIHGTEKLTFVNFTNFLETESEEVRESFTNFVVEVFDYPSVSDYKTAIKILLKYGNSEEYQQEKINMGAHIESLYKSYVVTTASAIYGEKVLELTDEYNIMEMTSSEISNYWTTKSSVLNSISSTNLSNIKELGTTVGIDVTVDDLISNKTSNATGKKYPLNSSPLLTKVLGGGFRKQTFTGFAAPSGVGKSKMAFNLAHDLAYSEGLNVLIITNELTEAQIRQHLLTVSINKMHKYMDDNERIRKQTKYTELEPVSYEEEYARVEELLYTEDSVTYKNALKEVKLKHMQEQKSHEHNIKALLEKTNRFMEKYGQNHMFNKEVELEILEETDVDGDNAEQIKELKEQMKYREGCIKIVDYNEQGEKTIAEIINEVNKDSRKLDVVIVDTLKADEREAQGKNKDSHAILKQMTQSIEKSVKQHSLIGIAMLQIADSENKKVSYDISSLAESKSAKDVMSTLIMFRNLREDERVDGDNQKLVQKGNSPSSASFSLPKLADDNENRKYNQDLMLFKVVKNRFGNGDLEFVLRADKGCNVFEDVGIVTHS